MIRASKIGLIVLGLMLAVACSDSTNAPDTQAAQTTATTPATATGDAATDEEITGPIVVYSSRQEHLITPLFDKFTAETGIEIQFQTGEDGPLIARLKAEGKQTFADILYTVDVGNLWSAADKGLLAPIDSPILEKNIPSHLRDPMNRWFGLSVRARTIAYSSERVDPSQLSTYAALADPKWKGKLCLRTSRKVYNMSLVATMIARLGEEETQRIVEGWVDNLATRVFSSDTLLLQAIAAGQCDVGIVNTYYLGQLQQEDPDFPVKIFWANQDTSGTHVNISGAGVTRYAKNPKAAQKLIEWLSTAEPQHMFSELNLEYPANPAIAPVDLVASWGDFKHDDLNVEVAGRLQSKAVMLMDRADYR